MKKILPFSRPRAVALFARWTPCLLDFRLPTIPHFLLAAAFCFMQLQLVLPPHSPTALSAKSEISESTAPQPDSPTDPSLEVPSDLPTPSETFDFTSDLIIKAVNPGYTIDQQSDVGELIELHKTTDTPLSLAGYAVRYTNSSGNSTLLLNFDESSFLAGETLLLRLARSPGSDQSDATYMTTLAMSTGRIDLLHYDDVVDTVCWGGKKSDSCLPAFKKANPTTLVRDLQTGEFVHLEVYQPAFDSDHPSLIQPDPPSPPSSDPDSPSDESADRPSGSCRGLEFSEIYTYYANDKAEQFVELYNSTSSPILLQHCSLRYKNKTYPLTGELAPESYHAYYPASGSLAFTFTKNPTASGTVELVDADGSVLDSLVYSHGQKKSTSFARFFDTSADEVWMQTYQPTPGAPNIHQEFRTCPAGKVINPATGNCVKATASAKTSTSAECPDGKYRNPLTGRCKKISTNSSEPKPCAEGYERNPETNRCRKKTSVNAGAGYALVPTTHSDKSTFIALGVVALLVSLGSIYIILQFRHELTRATRKTRQRLHHILKHLISRCTRFHRHKNP